MWDNLQDECPHSILGECQGLGRGEGDGHIIDTTPHPHLRFSRVRIQEPPDFIDCVHNSGDCNTLPEDFYGVLKHKLSKNVPKCSKLKIKVTATFQNGSTKELFALVDTGAEVNLINSKLIRPEIFTNSL